MLSPTIAEVTPIRITSQIWSLPWLARTAAATSAVSPGDGMPIDSSPMIAGRMYPRLLDRPMIAPDAIMMPPRRTVRPPRRSGGHPGVLEHGQQRQPGRHRSPAREPARLEPQGLLEHGVEPLGTEGQVRLVVVVRLAQPAALGQTHRGGRRQQQPVERGHPPHPPAGLRGGGAQAPSRITPIVVIGHVVRGPQTLIGGTVT